MAWLQATYQPTTLFSLRPSWATSTGGKSLLLPSPYAIKLALLDVALRVDGLNAGEIAWSWIRSLGIGIQLPEQIVVTNLFTKVLKMRRRPAPEGSADAGPFQKTIGYREYVYHPEPIQLAFEVDDEHEAQLARWLPHVTYLGKRGGFMQLLTVPQRVVSNEGFVSLTAETDTFPINGIIQQLDDCDPKMTFAQVNIYDKKRPKRITRHIVLPYRLTRSSRTYSLYSHTG